MSTLRVTVEIPIENRGKNAFGKPITNGEIEENVSYVLNIFLEQYLANLGAPKLGLVSCNGRIIDSDGDDH